MMRYAEITALPAPPEEADTNIINMVTMASSKGKTELPMVDVLDMLRREGYDLTPRMVMNILKKSKLVKDASGDTIQLVNNDADEDTGMIPDQKKEKAKKHVEKMAKQTIKKDSRKP